MVDSESCPKFPVTPYQAYYLDPQAGDQNKILTSIYHIKGKQIVSRLETAWNKIIERHEGLRVSFSQNGKEFYQIVNPATSLKFTYHLDNSAISIEEIVAKYCLLSDIDIGTNPLLRISFFYKDIDCYWMLLQIHHAIFDGVSAVYLFRDLLSLLEMKSLYEQSYSYAEYAGFLNEHFLSNRMQLQKKYWENKLLTKPIQFSLPTDATDSNINNPNKKSELIFNINAETNHRIDNFIRENKITRYVFFAGIFTLLLHNFSHCSEIVFASPTAARIQEKFKDIITACVNFVTFRVTVNQEDNLNLFFKNIFKEIFASLANMEYPFAAANSQVIAKQPLDSVLFFYHNHIPTNATKFISEDEQTSMELIHVHTSGETTGLRLEIVELDNTYLCKLAYNQALFKSDTAVKLFKKFQSLINKIIVSNNTKLYEFLNTIGVTLNAS